ncbi:MAG TPA: hypothetical protein VFY84_11590, partial [Jiangellales bacterium]|nr:hypothetical protein [Jiangellales bacterium]
MTRVWIRYAAIMALLVSAYFALPQSRPVVEAGVGLAAVGAVEFSVRRLRPQRAGAWRGLEVALALLAIGDVIFAIMDVGSPVPVPYPALPDAFYLAAYLPLTIALLWLGRPHTRRSGHIEYATPSAQTLFGRDVLGERVDDIVGHNRPVDL